MKLAALIIAAFASTSLAGNYPSTRPAAQETFPADLFRLSLQPALPVSNSQPPLPLFIGHVERVNLGYIGPSHFEGHFEDGMLLPLAPMRPPVDLIDDRR